MYNSVSCNFMLQAVPAQFAQMYVILGSGGKAMGKLYPAAFMLLPSKTAAVYKHAFQTVMQAVGTSPVSISIDFEQAVIKSARVVFTNFKTIVGCQFHRKKNLHFQMGQKGCLPFYHDNAAFQVGLDLIYAMDKLPVGDMILGWETVIVPHFEEHFNSDDNEEIEDFLGYVERSYVGKLNHRSGQRNKAVFPPEIWSNFKRILNNEPTTNNAVEAWNSTWNKSVGTNHNVLRVINHFKSEDSLARTKFQQVISGNNPDRNPGRTDRLSARMANLKIAATNYNPAFIKEYLYSLCGFDI